MKEYTSKTVYVGIDVHKKSYSVTAVCDRQVVKSNSEAHSKEQGKRAAPKKDSMSRYRRIAARSGVLGGLLLFWSEANGEIGLRNFFLSK